MALFRRSSAAKTAPEAVSAATPESVSVAPSGADGGVSSANDHADAGAPTGPGAGPYDSGDNYPDIPRVDLGSIMLPVAPGLQVRMEIDRATRKVTGISVIVGQSAMQLQAFAAPRTEGVWDEIREEIAAGLAKTGGEHDDVPGRFGRELIARVPGRNPAGGESVRAARFIGVDGPRWFLRGVLTGKAATDPEAAKPLEDIFSNVVVVRDNSPRPPRDLLTMTLPNQAAAPEAPVGQAEAPSFDPLKRGPEITEIH